jgi:hypothetical protein
MPVPPTSSPVKLASNPTAEASPEAATAGDDRNVVPHTDAVTTATTVSHLRIHKGGITGEGYDM